MSTAVQGINRVGLLKINFVDKVGDVNELTQEDVNISIFKFVAVGVDAKKVGELWLEFDLEMFAKFSFKVILQVGRFAEEDKIVHKKAKVEGSLVWNEASSENAGCVW